MSKLVNYGHENVLDLLDRMLGVDNRPFGDVLGDVCEEVRSDEKNHYLRVELPGFKPEEVTVTVKDGSVFVKAKTSSEDSSEHLWRSSIKECSLGRVLPRDVDLLAPLSAVQKDGVLTVTLPRKVSTQSQVKEIPVKVS